ncbi:hypothetical protein Ancab_012457, partial [Ancistrocladus abbreviatus]
DIFWPPKTDHYGKRYGFVRFADVQDQMEMVHHLDGIWIGSFRLRVKVARSREFVGNAVPVRRKVSPHRSFSPTRRRIRVSFAEVVHGDKSSSYCESQQKQTVALPFKSIEA